MVPLRRITHLPMNARNSTVRLITGVWILLAAGCHGDRHHSTTSDPPPGQGQAASLTVGGSTFGLLGTLTLEINGGDALTLTADGKFTFSNALLSGSSYSVAVQSQPVNQICTVSNGAGTLTNASVTTVSVNCSTLTRSLGGTVVGLAPSETAILQDNGGDNLTVNGNGGFTFTTPVAQSARYDVTVLTQPATQTCTVTNSSGTAGSSDITNVQVTCATNAYKVGGVVSGLSGTVVLQNNGTDNLSIDSDGAFAFSTPLAQGASYDVAVLTQPVEQTCTVTNGSGTMGGADLSSISVSCLANTTTLAASVADLALSVTGMTEYGVAGTPTSGLSRTITITNIGSYAAYNLSVAPPTWPVGTISSTTCGSTLAVGASCAITISPGSTPTSDGTNPCSSGTAPIPGAVQVGADNAATLSSDVVILSYGCIYQGGYVYAFDDTTPNTRSVGGQVVSTTDQASGGVIWSSTGSGSAYDAIFGISEVSTVSSPDPSGSSYSGQMACNGSADGACNTNNIYVYYESGAPNAPINVSYYAAGLCKQTIRGYSDWFLPAICQLGYGGAACGTSSVPAQQNMQSNLVDSNNVGLLSGVHWSSTESSLSPQFNAWEQDFSTAGGSQSYSNKGTQFGVRCSRSLTP